MRGKVAGVVVALSLFLGTACEETDPIDRGPLVVVDRADPQTEYVSSRDAGYGVVVAGPSVERNLWAFGDSVAWGADGIRLPHPLGWPSNTASLTTIDASGAPGALRQEMTTSGATVNNMRAFIRDPNPWNPTTDTVPSTSASTLDPTGTLTDREYCSASNGRFRAEWPKGMITLPDQDPATETVVVFYQNFCPLVATGLDFAPLPGGVAIYTWDASAPDAPPVAYRANDGLFPPGAIYNHQAGQNASTFTYGSGPILIEDAAVTYLATFMCGGAGDCAVARAPLSGVDAAADAQAIADPTAWEYLADDPLQGAVWSPFPNDGTRVTCVPTPIDPTVPSPNGETCDGALPLGQYPPAAAFYDATSDPSTQPTASPSFHHDGQSLAMLFMPACFAAQADANGSCPFPAVRSDAVIAYALQDPAAPLGVTWIGHTTFPLPPGCETGKGCRAPILHPELSSNETFGFSYFDEDGLYDLDDPDPAALTLRYWDSSGQLQVEATDKGRVMWGRTCVNAFLVAGYPCQE